MDLWNRLMGLAHYEEAKKEFVDISPEHPHINYARLPISAVHEMERFMTALEPRLAAIRTPALVLQSEGDPVVNPSGSRSLFEQLGSKEKDYLLIDLDRHGILLGKGSALVHTAIADFVDRLKKGIPPVASSGN